MVKISQQTSVIPTSTDSVLGITATGPTTRRFTFANILSFIAAGLAAATRWITTSMLGVDSVETINVKDANITNSKLAGSITPNKLLLGYCGYNGSVAPNQTTTSTTPQAITNASASITTNGGALIISMSAPLGAAAQTASSGLYINGTYYTLILTTLNDTTIKSGFNVIAAGVVPAGTYTVSARFASQNAGTTSTIQQYSTVSFSVVEI